MSEGRVLVFVYGTLLRGEPNHGLLASARPMGRSRTAPGFRLHDLTAILGPFPGMVAAGDGRVEGELYAVDGPTLAALDRLEDHPRLYHRRAIPLERGGGAEAYLMSPAQVVGAPVLETGRWPPPYRRHA